MANETPSKRILEAVHAKLTHSLNSDSPFKHLPQFSTPPSRFAIIKNPFEPLLLEKLHTHFMSPSIFTKIPSPKSEEKFKWTIDEISTFKPADIDETSIEQFEKTEADATAESFAQAKIDKFFSLKEIVPSPVNQAVNIEPLITDDVERPKRIPTKDGICQTILTFPPKLPAELEAILAPYFSYKENQQQADPINNSLYKKLFEFEDHEDGHEAASSTGTSPARSITLSLCNLRNFSYDSVESCRRNSGSPIDPKLDGCILSPIQKDSMFTCSRENPFTDKNAFDQISDRLRMSPIKKPSPEKKENKKNTVTRLDFCDRMSMDSLNDFVPDYLEKLPSNEQSFTLNETPSPKKLQSNNDSLVNWDMEYRNLSQDSPSKTNVMDVSNSNTPKSKIFTSQRKKLSESFLREDREDDAEVTFADIGTKASSSRRIFKDDITDAGYQTGINTLSDDSSWTNSNLFASTPTKNKINF